MKIIWPRANEIPPALSRNQSLAPDPPPYPPPQDPEICLTAPVKRWEVRVVFGLRPITKVYRIEAKTWPGERHGGSLP